MKKIITLLCCLFSYLPFLHAQEEDQKTPHKIVYLGAGVGQEFGGFGMSAEVIPDPYVGIFLGGGYNLATPACSFGVSVKMLPKTRITPVFLAMYGYNAAVRYYEYNRIKGKSYYGFSFGIGTEIKLGRSQSKISLSLLYPFRSEEAKYALKGWNNKNVPPFTFGIGLHI